MRLGLNPMIDDPAIRNLIMDITRRNTTVRPERASSPSRAQNSQAQSKKVVSFSRVLKSIKLIQQSEAVCTTLLLDNLSEEEDSSSEESHEKGVFFQDLLLSTLTDRRLNLVTYSRNSLLIHLVVFIVLCVSIFASRDPICPWELHWPHCKFPEWSLSWNVHNK